MGMVQEEVKWAIIVFLTKGRGGVSRDRDRGCGLEDLCDSGEFLDKVERDHT